jgi:hypothetical protein
MNPTAHMTGIDSKPGRAQAELGKTRQLSLRTFLPAGAGWFAG